jgi:hypothetical protein
MPKYHPIDCKVAGRIYRATTLLAVSWRQRLLEAVFDIGDPQVPTELDQWLRVRFDYVEMFRILDEMPLRTEEDPKTQEGLVTGHFAYGVDGGAFFRSQSEAFRHCFRGHHHFQFITDNDCLDVIAPICPTFLLVDARWHEVHAHHD